MYIQIYNPPLLSVTQVDPFVAANTIASVCIKVFRTLFLRPKEIPIIPEG